MIGRPFRSVLIANRGEIAVSIVRACRDEGLRAVAVFSDADAGALHVRRADEAHLVGPAPASESYLGRTRLIEVALQSGAEAVHPGYGFLAEDASFAQAVVDAGLVWIGPPVSAMRQLGDKAAAKATAERLGVPTLPGYHGSAQDDATLSHEAERIGFPLLVKATAGGGGRGMRIVRERLELPEALAGARREALAAFGSDGLMLERLLESPRHIEMQIFGDTLGNVLYLGERDCSIQRRHQKILEEGPAPGFGAQQRRAMGEASVALARAAGYVNAGTVEYLLDRDGRFYFLEVNTRLQVEHPVTEMITGLDLVRLQLRVAAGAPIGLGQEALTIRGHAIEARIFAEDPARAFLPSSGRLSVFELARETEPDPYVLWETGYEGGDTVPASYDPLLAKLIVWGVDRDQAIASLARQLNAVRCEGIATNTAFLSDVVESEAFGSAEIRTDFLQVHGLEPWPPRLSADVLFAAVAATIRHPEIVWPREQRAELTDSLPSPWQAITGWRQGWVGCEVCLEHQGRRYTVRLRMPDGLDGAWWFQEGEADPVRWTVRLHGSRVVLANDGPEREFEVAWTAPGLIAVTAGRRARTLTVESPSSSEEDPDGPFSHEAGRLTAPLPGRIVRIMISPGQVVHQGQPMLTLEAMKIEHLLAAPRPGAVTRIHVEEGDQVEPGALLAELEDPT